MSPHKGAVNLFTAGLEKQPFKPPPFMMPLIQTKIRCQLGCRLEYQGPRQTTSRVAGDKSTTGPNNAKEKKKYSKNSLNLLQWNAEGLGTNKVLELKKLLKDRKIHLALIQETKLRSKLPPSFPGYDLYQCDCTNQCQGIITLVRSDIQATVSKVKTKDRNDIHHIQLWYDGRKYTIYNIYSPPNTTFDVQDGFQFHQWLTIDESD